MRQRGSAGSSVVEGLGARLLAVARLSCDTIPAEELEQLLRERDGASWLDSIDQLHLWELLLIVVHAIARREDGLRPKSRPLDTLSTLARFRLELRRLVDADDPE